MSDTDIYAVVAMYIACGVVAFIILVRQCLADFHHATRGDMIMSFIFGLTGPIGLAVALWAWTIGRAKRHIDFDRVVIKAKDRDA